MVSRIPPPRRGVCQVQVLMPSFYHPLTLMPRRSWPLVASLATGWRLEGRWITKERAEVPNYAASEPPRMRGSNKFAPRTREAAIPRQDRQNRDSTTKGVWRVLGELSPLDESLGITSDSR